MVATARPHWRPTGGLITLGLLAVALVPAGAVVGGRTAARMTSAAFSLESTRGERFDEVLVVRADDHTAVSVAFSHLAFPDGGSDTIVLGRDDAFPDNLAAGVLLGRAPLLLTGGARLHPLLRQEITRLGATRALIVGGPAAVSQAVEAELAALGLAVNRLHGPTRVETALAIATFATPDVREALLVRARDAQGGDGSQAWADALAAGAWAAAARVPVLLTDTAALHPAVAAWLAQTGVRAVHAVGGTAALAPGVTRELVEQGLETRRIAGPERAGTAVELARLLWRTPDASAARRVVLVDGSVGGGWAVGVAAATAAASLRAPVVLAAGGMLPPATQQWLAEGGDLLVCGAFVHPAACGSAAGAAPAGQAGGSASPAPPSLPPPVPPGPVVRLTDSADGVALFHLESMFPGHVESRHITVRNAGQVALLVRLHAALSGTLAPYLELRVIADPDGAGEVLHDGGMDAFAEAHRDWASGAGQWAAEPGAVRTFAFVVAMPADAGQEVVGRSSTVTFVWEGRNG